MAPANNSGHTWVLLQYTKVLVSLFFIFTLTISIDANAGEPANRVQTAIDEVIGILKDQALAGDKQTAARRAAIR